jgi:hypothetical protein
VAFIHDEILLEIPEDSNWDHHVLLIEDTVCKAMQVCFPQHLKRISTAIVNDLFFTIETVMML